MSTQLVFDELTHTYKFNGNVVPGVTTVLESVGISDFSNVPEDTLKYAADRGTAIHLACEYHDNDELEEVPQVIKPYFDQYIKFLSDFDVEIVEVEKKVFCEKYLYAGTLDRIAILKKVSDQPVLFDIKTGQPSIAHQIQTAAYEYAYKQDKRSKMDRYTLYLSSDGYKVSEPYKSRQDFDVFLAALTVHNYKKRSK